jgi:hypothetical protein
VAIGGEIEIHLPTKQSSKYDAFRNVAFKTDLVDTPCRVSDLPILRMETFAIILYISVSVLVNSQEFFILDKPNFEVQPLLVTATSV